MPTLRALLLEDRVTPAVTTPLPTDQLVFDGRPLYLALPATSTPAGSVAASVTSGDPAVTAEVVRPGRSVRFDLSGTDGTGQPFTGSLTLRLFDDSAPAAAQRVVDLINSGFYNGKLFHRVLPGFVIQGGSPNGDGVGGSPLPDVDDEFRAEFTFASPGIVAMANAGDDGNDSQFFVTDPDIRATDRPQSLNFNHSIIGILTNGFDTYRRAINTPTAASAGGERSRPVNPVTIIGAAVVSETPDTVIRLSADAGYRGTTDIKYALDDTGDQTSATATGSFRVTGAAAPVNSRAFLNPVPAAVSVGGAPTTIQLSATDLDGDALTFAARNLAFAGTPERLTVSVDAATGLATLTPPAGFFGVIQFRVGVRDQTDRAGRGLDTASNFDTQLVTLTVAPAVALAAPPTLTRGASGAVTADVSGPADTAGTVEFRTADGATLLATAPVVNGRATASVSFAAAGTYSVVARFTASDAAIPVAVSSASAVVVTESANPSPPTPEPPPPEPPTPDPDPGVLPATVVGVSAGLDPVVTVGYSDGTTRRIQAFDADFLGGVTAILADVTGDGVAEAIAVPLSGGGSVLKVFDARTGALLFVREAFEASYRGGLSVSAGDFAGRGYSQIVIGAGSGGGPRVAVFDVPRNATLLDTFVGDPAGRSGAVVTVVDDAGTPRIRATAGTSVALFDGTTGAKVADFADATPDPSAPATPVQPEPEPPTTAPGGSTVTVAAALAGGTGMRAFLGSTRADELAL